MSIKNKPMWLICHKAVPVLKNSTSTLHDTTYNNEIYDRTSTKENDRIRSMTGKVGKKKAGAKRKNCQVSEAFLKNRAVLKL